VLQGIGCAGLPTAGPAPVRDAPLLPGPASEPGARTRGPQAAGAASDAPLAALRRDAEAVLAGLVANRDGEVYAGAVTGTDPEDFAIAVARVDGGGFSLGEASLRFPLMSVSKPFTYAAALEQRGAAFMVDTIGMSATGFPYNSVAAGAVRPTTLQNPMVNAGAIATHSFLEGEDAEAKLERVVTLYSAMAGRPLAVEPDWHATPRDLTYTLAYQMKAAGRLEGDPHDVASRYLDACIVGVRVEELAQMGATLANDGVQPVTGERVLSRETARTVLAAMTVAGMYEDSGRWWTRVGVPAKSGVSGAILAVVPGWGALVAYSPRLDAAGNSVRGALAIEALVSRWRLHSLDRLLDGAGPPARVPPGAARGAPLGEADLVASM